MFILRMKNPQPDASGWTAMKTPLGWLFVAFSEERHGQAYLKAAGFDDRMEVVSREALLERTPYALDRVSVLLLLPSLDAVLELLRDADTFPYERFVVDPAALA